MADQVLSLGMVPGTPAGIIAIDIFTNVAPDDTWTSAGIRGLTSGGATLIHGATPINPGNGNQFVTMLSVPYSDPGNPNRFTNGLAASGGGYSPTSPFTELTANEISITWFASPPVTVNSPSVDGAFARIALNIGATGFTNAECFVGTGEFVPPGSTVLFRSVPAPGSSQTLGTAAGTFDVPALVGSNWFVYAAVVSFVNGGFAGSLAGWSVANTSNGVGAPGTLASIDIDGPGPLPSSFAARFAAGQATFQAGVQHGVSMSQALSLAAGTTYVVDFDWSAQKFSAADTVDGGTFSLIVNGAIVAQASAGTTGVTLPRYGHVTGQFTPSVSGPASVGFRITRGFLPAIDLFQYVDNVTISVAPPAQCYPNCDGSTTNPCLNVQDFACFLNRYAAADAYANCDGSTTAPVLNVQDFACFLNAYAAGCSGC